MAAENGENREHQTTVVLKKSTNDRWTDFVKGSDLYESKGHLIRQAVNKEINGDDGGAGVEELDGLRSDVDLLKEDMRVLKRGLSDIQSVLESLEIRTRGPDPDIKEIMDELYPILPTHEDFIEYQKATSKVGESLGDAPVGPPKTDSGRLEAFAERLDESVMDVHQAIQNLQDDTKLIQTREVDGETRFMRVE